MTSAYSKSGYFSFRAVLMNFSTALSVSVTRSVAGVREMISPLSQVVDGLVSREAVLFFLVSLVWT